MFGLSKKERNAKILAEQAAKNRQWDIDHHYPTADQLHAVMDGAAIVGLPNGWGNLNGEYIHPETVSHVLRQLSQERPTRHYRAGGKCVEIVQRGIDSDSHYRDRWRSDIDNATWERMKIDEKAGIDPEAELNESLMHLYTAMGRCFGMTGDEYARWLEERR